MKLGYCRDICTSRFIEASFTLAKIWEQPKCPSTDDWIKKVGYQYLYIMQPWKSRKSCCPRKQDLELLSSLVSCRFPCLKIWEGCKIWLSIIMKGESYRDHRGGRVELAGQELHTPRCQWLMPVILATQKAEIRKIVVQSQLGANSLGDPISKNPSQKDWLSGSRCRPWVQTPVPQKKKLHTEGRRGK
jgi:hypothetical protein